MKTKTSSYVLAAEILAIILFHAVKINQAEKHPTDIVAIRPAKSLPLHKSGAENNSGIEYMLVNLIK
jgi:hypothetical protein